MSERGGLAIRAARAFDGERLIRDGALVLCRDGKIVGVEAASTPAPEGFELRELPNATVLPGLIDCHVHLCADSRNGALDRLPDLTDDEVDDAIDRGLRAQLAAGVTTVRDLGDRRWAVVDRRDRQGDGAASPALPTIVASGPPITTRAGHCWHMGGEAESPDEIAAAIRERAERGVDVVKVMASGGTMTAGTDVLACQYTLEQLRLIVEAAHAANLGVTSHAHGLPAVERSIAAGVDGIEHCSCFTESGIELSETLLAQLVTSGITVCPTIGKAHGVTPPPAVVAMQERTGTTLAARNEMAGRMCEAGVNIVSGVDAGISEGKRHGVLPVAVADLVAGGAAPAVALATATSRAAAACGLGASKGFLRAGYDADVIVVEGDPIVDITALERLRALYLRGEPQPVR